MPHTRAPRPRRSAGGRGTAPWTRWAAALACAGLLAPAVARGQPADPPGEPGAPIEVAAPAPPAGAVRARVLERAAAHVASGADLVEALDVARGLTTATFELSCAISLLIPDDGQLPWWDALLGVGCLGASVGLFVANGLRLARLREGSEARDVLRRVREAAADGLDVDEAAALEGAIHQAAAETRRTRAVGMVLGGASWVATGVLAWAVAADRIDDRAGTAIAIATFVAGGLGLSLALVESPAERASAAIERLGGPDARGGASVALHLAPWVGPGGAGWTLAGRW